MTKSSKSQFSIGVDYGTNSVRALVVDTSDGTEVAMGVFDYPSGDDGVLVDPKDPNLARQNPADYVDGFFSSVRQVISKAKRVKGFAPERVVGIGIDTTGSTPIPVDREGTPLAMLPKFKSSLAAQAWLWKDHTAHAEAAEITEKASNHPDNYLASCGGTYSSEWYWSKILHCKRSAPAVFRAAYSWVEQADFIPAYVTGNCDPERMCRSVCAAGHKAMYSEQWDGLPEEKFLSSLDKDLVPIRRHYAKTALPSNQIAGQLTEAVAKKVGLPPGIPVAVGTIDAHSGAVGAGIKPGALVKIIGTSTCDMMVAPMDAALPNIPGLCGVVPGSIIPGMYGFEAGQSAVGDIFNWFVNQFSPGRYSARGDVHVQLTHEAEKLLPGESGLLALDWNNGNRTPLVDPLLTGLLVGQTLHTSAPEVYRALVEATAFGALTIIHRFEEYGVQVKEIVNCGGIAEKNPFVMQIYSDVCDRPLKISRSAQTCALGAAIFGAVVGGAYQRVEQAQRNMTGVKSTVYRPVKKRVCVYQELFRLYKQLHDAFGTSTPTELGNVMKELIAIRNRVRND